jgi:trehalose 6-phosphate synthase
MRDVSDTPASPVPDRLAELPVVLLSHRGPVSWGREAATGERTAPAGQGGLVTALSGLTGHLADVVWVCVAPGGEDAEVAREAGGEVVRVDLTEQPHVVDLDAAAERPVRLRMVEIPAEVHDAFYGVVANPLLWFLQHRLHDLGTSPSLGRDERAAFDDGYVRANELAADAVVAQVEAAAPDGRAVVLLHDYHFYLVGDLVRQRCPAP